MIPALEPRDEPVVLARRDLFDARFQLLAHGAGEETGPQEAEEDNTSQALRFVDAPSDLVRGVYEGGMKTWECAVDLAAYLHARRAALLGEVPKGKRILEVSGDTLLLKSLLLHSQGRSVVERRCPASMSYITYSRGIMFLHISRRSICKTITKLYSSLSHYQTFFSHGVCKPQVTFASFSH